MSRQVQTVLRLPADLVAGVDAYRRAFARRSGVGRNTGRRLGGRALSLRLLVLRGLAATDAAGLARPAESFSRDGPTAAHLHAWRAEVAPRGPAQDRWPPVLVAPAVPDPGALRRQRPGTDQVRICMVLPSTLIAWVDRFRMRLEARHPECRLSRNRTLELLLWWGLREEALHGPRDLNPDLRVHSAPPLRPASEGGAA